MGEVSGEYGRDTAPRIVRWLPPAAGAATPAIIAVVGLGYALLFRAGGVGEHAWLGLSLLVACAVLWRVAGVSVVVSLEGLIVRGIVRRRRYEWDQIASVEYDTPRWMSVAFWQFGGGDRVRIRLANGRSFCPLALHTTMDYERRNRAVGAMRRNMQDH